jgi:hypothetical protein
MVLAAATLLVTLAGPISAVASTVQGKTLAFQEDESGDKAGTGQSKPDAETGASKKESEPAAEETGPPWTYQMAWISIALTVFLLLGTGSLYWRLVVTRRRQQEA